MCCPPNMELMSRSWLLRSALSATCSGIRWAWSIPISRWMGPAFWIRQLGSDRYRSPGNCSSTSSGG
ncbi:MAG: hypothetical protein ACK55Z_37515, partial [bacterium]